LGEATVRAFSMSKMAVRVQFDTVRVWLVTEDESQRPNHFCEPPSCYRLPPKQLVWRGREGECLL
jgi:hypothetical protein